MMIRRCASNRRCQTMMLAMPVSSSIVRNMTLAVPGRWRTRTIPAISTRAVLERAEIGAGRISPPSSSSRRKLSGCARSDSWIAR